MSGSSSSPGDDYAYDAFASYSSEIDKDLVFDLESFVESLHRNRLVEAPYRKRLDLCVDGSDFTLPRKLPNRGSDGAIDRGIKELIVAYLKQCRHLLLLVGPRSRDHPWVNFELDWWIANRGPDSVIVAVTHGALPPREKLCGPD